MLLNIGNGMPAYAYDDPIVTIEGPDAIMIGQTVTYKYTITYEGEDLDEGEFDFTGSSAGAGQVAGGFSVPVTATRHPAHGGYYTDDVDVEINKLVDVVVLVSAVSSRPFALINRPVKLTATTIPASYASQVEWWAMTNASVTGGGANAEGYALGPGDAEFMAVLAINGINSYKPTKFKGVKVENKNSAGGEISDYVTVANSEQSASKHLNGNPPGSLQFVPSSPINFVIADAGVTDQTEYLMAVVSPGGMVPLIGPWVSWASTAKWEFDLTFSGFGHQDEHLEISAGNQPLKFADSAKGALLIQVTPQGPIMNLSFQPNQIYYASSNAHISAEINGIVGMVGFAGSAAKSVGGIGWIVTLVDVS